MHISVGHEGEMTKNQYKAEINDRLGQVLQHTRLQSGRSISSLAAAMDLTELELQAIEERPAEIPCRKLYQVIEQYGPSVQMEVQDALCDIHFIGVEHRARRSWLEKAGEWLRFEFRRQWRVILATFSIRILINLWQSFR